MPAFPCTNITSTATWIKARLSRKSSRSSRRFRNSTPFSLNSVFGLWIRFLEAPTTTSKTHCRHATAKFSRHDPERMHIFLHRLYFLHPRHEIGNRLVPYPCFPKGISIRMGWRDPCRNWSVESRLDCYLHLWTCPRTAARHKSQGKGKRGTRARTTPRKLEGPTAALPSSHPPSSLRASPDPGGKFTKHG